ncbi:Ribonuclease HII [Candidatus Hepatincolaceae symbiont of Richtersius coronifer]
MPNFDYEMLFFNQLNFKEPSLKQLKNLPMQQTYNFFAAGCDEVGRGCLAGPVVACCLALKPNLPLKVLSIINDSKVLNPKKRQEVVAYLKQYSDYGVAEISVAIIDKINILQAALQAMTKAYYDLINKLQKNAGIFDLNTTRFSTTTLPKLMIVDGNQKIELDIPVFTLVGGDSKSLNVAAASIVAKVHRDELMRKLGEQYPQYQWDKNKGYGTANHLKAVNMYGMTIHHRKSFAPFKKEKFPLYV